MLGAMEGFGIEPGLVEEVCSMHSGSKARVRERRIITEKFEIKKGVTQGCPLSPYLFNLYLERLMMEAFWCVMWGIRINKLRYADNIVLLAATLEDLMELRD